MVTVINGMKATTRPVEETAPVEVGPKPRVKAEYRGSQRASSIFSPMKEWETIRVLVDGQEYEVARIG